ncbi:hypothetical protein DN068_02200 [Taibaiella soli]|uniref:Carboxypeptidase-like regulatory domain-containing protein n=2 Tax=Taibaiella soli TaxID=1649169 RepID=A0A2W2ALF9_9BACT|nr:hypothetical protein DN068_02200 [Taibaiella soli]
MTPDTQGRLCVHCQKSVIDFTAWNDADLHAFFLKNNHSVCGRFLSRQLDRNIQLPVQKPTNLYRIAIALGLSLMFSQLPEMHARPKPPLMEQNMFVQEVPQNDTTGSDSLVIRGIVLDATKQPAIGAIINVQQNDISIGGQFTDIDGNYTIIFHNKPKGKFTVTAQYAGCHRTTITIDSLNQNNILLNFSLEKSSNVLTGEVIMKYVRPVADPARPGTNSIFSREQINHTAY